MNPKQAYIALAEAVREKGSPTCEQADPEAFYPVPGQAASYETRMAKEFCKSCPVQTECLTYALIAQEPYGIWGGTTAEERRKMYGRVVTQRRSA